jgi:hypothetical protein
MLEIVMDIHESESKSVRASGYEDKNGKFVVLEGSFAVDDSLVQSSLSEKPKRAEIRKSLIQSGKLINSGNKYRFTENVEFNSPSEAASIIWGSNLNGRKVFGIGEDVLPSYKLYFDIENPKAIEGYKKDRILASSERDRGLVAARKEKDNYTCQACGLFIKIEGKYVIECHHLNPLSLGVRETHINDLVSLCPTCHRIAHMREPIYSVSEIAAIRASNKRLWCQPPQNH